MNLKRRAFLSLGLFGALFWVADRVEARGGRGGGRGGPGGGGGGRGGRGPSPGGRGGRGGRGGNNRGGERKEEEERQRREERLARVRLAREEYAKRERELMWDAEAAQRMDQTLRRVLGSATE